MRFIWIASVFLLGSLVAGCNHAQKPSVTATGDASQIKFSQCMRDQGMTWFPDPAADGGLKVSVPEGTDQAAFDAAEQACRKYQPGADNNGGTITAEDLAKLRQVSQCVREHGITKYPDPDEHGSISVDSGTVGADPDDPAFQKAMEECRKYLPARRGNS